MGAYTREQAFGVTVRSLARSLSDRTVRGDERAFLEAVFRSALSETADTPPAGAGMEAFGTLPSLQQPSLAIVREALLRLSREDRALLLLRDQCHLPFTHIAAIVGGPERGTRSSCLGARERLRALVEEVLNRGASRAM